MKILGVASLIPFGNLLAGWVGMPWQAMLAYTLLAALLTAGIALAQILVPQDSHDKVLWWNALLRHKKKDKPSPSHRPAPSQIAGTSRPGAGRQSRPAVRQRPPARSP